jgi:hypothetical protein
VGDDYSANSFERKGESFESIGKGSNVGRAARVAQGNRAIFGDNGVTAGSPESDKVETLIEKA